MRDDNLRPMWSENELDAALAALRSDVDTADTLTGARAELMAAAGDPTGQERPMTLTITPISQELEPPRKPRRGRLVAVAAAVTALAAGAVLVTTQGAGEAPPGANPITVDLGNGHTVTVDQPVLSPGQFRLQQLHSGHTTSGGNSYEVRQEGFTDIWSPAMWTDEWLRHYRPGDVEWLQGTEEQARADGILTQLVEEPAEERARCGAFLGDGPSGLSDEQGNPIDPCGGEGWSEWLIASPEFYTSLPTDPRRLYEAIVQNVGDSGNDPHTQALINGTTLLQPTTPPEVRATVLRALALIPGVRLVENATNLDGRQGLAFVVDDQNEDRSYTVFVDPATGDVIGTKETLNGEPLAEQASTWSVVDEIGAT